jgi:hypothetical protein
MKSEIFELIKKSDYVSFGELSYIKGFKGDFLMMHPKFENIIFWNDISENAIQCLIELIKEEKIYIHPTEELLYIGEGGFPNLPIAKTPKDYKTPHWLPIVFSNHPYTQKEK